jgi:hsp70-interacting protein
MDGQYLALDPLPTVVTCLRPSTRPSQQLRSKAIYALSGLLRHNAAAIAPFAAAGGWDALRGALSGTTPPRPALPFCPCPYAHHIPVHSHAADSDIGVRRKAAFLLNNLLTPSAAVAPAPPPSTRILGGGEQAPEGAPVHPNSHASMVADPASADTAPQTLHALGAHGLLPVLVRELTEPTPYGPDGDKGDGGDADLEEKLTR